MTDYLARPRKQPTAGILAMHAWWGVNDFFRAFCDRLASEGYLALAPDLYQGSTAATIAEAEKLRKGVDRAQAAAIIIKSLKNLQTELKNTRVGLIGFSMGANWALWLVEDKPTAIAATILFYGTRGGDYSQCKSAFLGHFAELDDYVSASGVKKLEKTLRTEGKDAAFFSYPGTHHWFFENDRPEFDPAAADLAWKRSIEFLHNSFA